MNRGRTDLQTAVLETTWGSLSIDASARGADGFGSTGRH